MVKPWLEKGFGYGVAEDKEFIGMKGLVAKFMGKPPGKTDEAHPKGHEENQACE
jgi:hypothetical protein